MQIFPLNMMIFPLKIVIFPLKIVIFQFPAVKNYIYPGAVAVPVPSAAGWPNHLRWGRHGSVCCFIHLQGGAPPVMAKLVY